MANYRKENPDVKEPYYIKCYINGLRGEIKHYMKPLKPANLYEAVVYAKDMEKGMLATAQSHNRRLTSAGGSKSGFSGQYQQSKRPPLESAPVVPVQKKETELAKPRPEVKFNEPGVCKYCGQKWFFGHRCQQFKRLNLMATEENNDSEEEQFHDTTPEENTENSSPDTQEDSKLMQISVQAVRGQPANNTFTLQIVIAGKNATALVDTGSTHTFMDLKFSTKLNCPTTTHAVEKVIVAGGGELLTGSQVQDIAYTIHHHQFKNSFKILPLKGYDIVLGGDWLLTHSPVKFDYVTRKLKIRLEGKTKIELPDNSLHKGVQLMSMDKLEKTLSKGATGYLLFPLTAVDKSVPSTHPEIAALLQEFSDVFEEPTTLPPERQCDHTIPLKECSTPPNIRPYRVPHKQKAEMEAQIKQLLEASIIQPSQSPYASPAILVRKRDGTWRLCIDFRKLNLHTIKNKFPIPVIEDLLDELHGARYFSKLDLRAGYHQIRMNKQDIHKTAFRTYFGHFEYLVMPFGLTNAPATFQALMNKVFEPLMRKIMLVFFDDILIFSKTLADHT
jgi:hypothetical protein